MDPPNSSSTFSINQNYNSIMGSMKNLLLNKGQESKVNDEFRSNSQTVLPKIGEGTNGVTGNSMKQGIRKSKSENTVRSATSARTLSLKGALPFKTGRKSSLSAPLDNITENEFFGSTVPPRSLLKKPPKPAKEQNTRIDEIRKDIGITGDTLNKNGNNSIKQNELSISTTKDGKRLVRRKKQKQRRSRRNSTEDDSILDNGVTKRTRRKSISRRGSITGRKPSVSNIGGLSMAMWIHKFLYKSKRSASLKLHGGDPKIQDAGGENVSGNAVSNSLKPAITVTKNIVSQIATIDKHNGDKNNVENKSLETKSKPKQMLSTVLADNQIHSWGFLRNQLVSAKVREAFSTVKFELKSHRLQVLRELGEGGYSKVFDVFDEKHDLYALKVVKLMAEGEEDMDRTLKKNNKIVDEEDIMKEISILEMFQNTPKVINMIDYEIRTDVSLPLCKICLPAQRSQNYKEIYILIYSI